MIAEAPIAELRQAMDSGELTARAIAEWYLARIEQIDKAGPALNSVIEINPDALGIAAALDDERAARGPRGPLHGIPLLLKDNIDTADRMATSAGSLALAGSIAAEDSWVAARLRAAGAVILGKTNLSEWANFRSTHSTSGWSSRGGQTRNPYALDRNPCGSSSGSAVAVAAGLCAAAVGTETDGSIICPAHVNGIVGIKPTVGLISRHGIIPISHSQDTAGPMARGVADAATLLGAMTGVDPRDPATEASAGRFHTDYTRFLDAGSLRGARIGVARNCFGFNDHVDRLMAACLDTLRRLGAELIDPADVTQSTELGEAELEVLLYEFKAGLNAYLARLGPGAAAHSLADVIEYNESHRGRVMPYFGQEHMLAALARGTLEDEKYRSALETCRRLAATQGIDAAFEQHRLDALVAPSGGPAWPTDLINGDHFAGTGSIPGPVAGYPSITVPAGFVFGLPVGILFAGRAYDEPRLIAYAYAFEQATRARRAPQFLPCAELEARADT